MNTSCHLKANSDEIILSVCCLTASQQIHIIPLKIKNIL
jgi:hypothetical protein